MGPSVSTTLTPHWHPIEVDLELANPFIDEYLLKSESFKTVSKPKIEDTRE